MSDQHLLDWMADEFTRRLAEGTTPTAFEKRVYRISWICGACEAVHVQRGSLFQCMSAANAVMVFDGVQVSIENEGFAQELDLLEADNTVTQPRPDELPRPKPWWPFGKR